MRLVTGGAPGASIHDMWAHSRDHGRAAIPSEVKAFADALAPMPPSKGLRKRIARDRTEAFTAPPRVPCGPKPVTVSFFEAQLRELRGMGVAEMPDTGARPPVERVSSNRADIAHALPLNDAQRALRAAQRFAECSRLAGFGMDAAVNAWKLYGR